MKNKFKHLEILVALRKDTLKLVQLAVVATGAVIKGISQSDLAILTMAGDAFAMDPEKRVRYWAGIRAEYCNGIREMYPDSWTRGKDKILKWNGIYAQICGARLSELSTLVKYSVNNMVNIPTTLQESQREYKRVRKLINAEQDKTRKPKVKTDADNSVKLAEYPSVESFAHDLVKYASTCKNNKKLASLIARLRAEFLVATQAEPTIQTLADAERASRIGQ